MAGWRALRRGPPGRRGRHRPAVRESRHRIVSQSLAVARAGRWRRDRRACHGRADGAGAAGRRPGRRPSWPSACKLLDRPAEIRRFDVLADDVANVAAREARSADTFVALRPNGSLDPERLVEGVLFGSGRHLYLVPETERPEVRFRSHCRRLEWQPGIGTRGRRRNAVPAQGKGGDGRGHQRRAAGRGSGHPRHRRRQSSQASRDRRRPASHQEPQRRCRWPR